MKLHPPHNGIRFTFGIAASLIGVVLIIDGVAANIAIFEVSGGSLMVLGGIRTTFYSYGFPGSRNVSR